MSRLNIKKVNTLIEKRSEAEKFTLMELMGREWNNIHRKRGTGKAFKALVKAGIVDSVVYDHTKSNHHAVYRKIN